MADISIGTKLWVAKPRIYGWSGREPSFENRWETITVFGENRVNWLVGYKHSPHRLNKKTLRFSDGKKYCLTEESAREVYKQDRWLERNRWRFGDAVNHCDYETIRRVAEVIGYVDPEDAGRAALAAANGDG